MSLVSFVIPAHNQARFLAEAIAGALDQTHPWVEAVVVDDGSIDDTAALLEAYRNTPNVTIVRQANAGVAAARNRGLQDARGDFVCFLDADDFVDRQFAARLLGPLTADQTLGMSYCDVQVVDVNGVAHGDFSVGGSRRQVTGDIFGSLLIGGYFPPHAVLVRRSLLDQTGAFDLELAGHADYELWLRLAALGHRAHYVDERLAFYRVHDGSMSRDREDMRQTRAAALERISQHFPARTAGALSAVQEFTTDLSAANTWLRDRWETLTAQIAAAARPSWSLVDTFGEARHTRGKTDHLGLWNVPDGDSLVRCVYLHPPSTLRAVVPTGAAGVLSAAVSLHPDVWTNPRTSGCLFSVSVDDVVLGGATLDPLQREGDRRWVSLSLDVPASGNGEHVLTLATEILGTGYFAWGLFRDVRFRAAD